MLMFLRDSGFLHPSLRVLHMAPEEGIQRHLRWRAVYVGADLAPGPRTTHTFDVQEIPFPDGSFDLVLCSHVLEHVPYDRRALREFARVLSPAGQAVFQHPIDTSAGTTAEDPPVTDPVERDRLYGQFDHLRMYGADFPARVGEAGLAAEPAGYRETLSEADVARFALHDGAPVTQADIYLARPAG
jgi:SAM-dependent methyltransferase